MKSLEKDKGLSSSIGRKRRRGRDCRLKREKDISPQPDKSDSSKEKSSRERDLLKRE